MSCVDSFLAVLILALWHFLCGRLPLIHSVHQILAVSVRCTYLLVFYDAYLFIYQIISSGYKYRHTSTRFNVALHY